jgi:hypothetical protein
VGLYRNDQGGLLAWGINRVVLLLKQGLGATRWSRTYQEGQFWQSIHNKCNNMMHEYDMSRMLWIVLMHLATSAKETI